MTSDVVKRVAAALACSVAVAQRTVDDLVTAGLLVVPGGSRVDVQWGRIPSEGDHGGWVFGSRESAEKAFRGFPVKQRTVYYGPWEDPDD